MEFQAWPKIARLNREIVITEKIDGTNSAVIIEEVKPSATVPPLTDSQVEVDGSVYDVGAQSRKQIITPERDNFGFAQWVRDNAEELVRLLGPGQHFGEWWGAGIQRGYGLPKGERYFSLFDTERYANFGRVDLPLRAVPILYRGLFNQHLIEDCIATLRREGSAAAPGFMKPEGVIVYHTAAGMAFKVTLERDEAPKGSIHWGGDGV